MHGFVLLPKRWSEEVEINDDGGKLANSAYNPSDLPLVEVLCENFQTFSRNFPDFMALLRINFRTVI